MYFGDNNRLYGDIIEKDREMIADPYGYWKTEVTGYARETFFLKRWLGFPKYTHFQKIGDKFVIVGYTSTIEDRNERKY